MSCGLDEKTQNAIDKGLDRMDFEHERRMNAMGLKWDVHALLEQTAEDEVDARRKGE